MQIMINIPDAIKEMADEGDKKLIHLMWMIILVDAIKNGVVLPKGHGRLIDETKLEDIIHDKGFNRKFMNPVFGMMQVFEMIDDVPTVIEADKENTE